MDKQYPYGKGLVKWVSTDWLADHLDDDDLMILDAQPNIHDYIQEHIPGAVYMNEGLLRVPLNGMPGQYISTEAMEQNLRRVGVRNDTPILVYTAKGPFKGWGDGLEQTMIAYTLARFGHEHILVLDGGGEKWKAENKPLAQEYADIESSNFRARVKDDFFITYEPFKALKDADNVALLDARPPKVYEGQGPWRKPGHIPGAINVPWANFMTEDNTRKLKSDDEIQAILDKHELTPDKTIICSCGTGREATNEFLLFKWYLGYPDVKIYEGSFTEWVAYPENETVTGPNPR